MKAILFTALGALCVQAFASDNWPQFRGPNASGVSTNANLPDKWSTTENVAWKADLPGRGGERSGPDSAARLVASSRTAVKAAKVEFITKRLTSAVFYRNASHTSTSVVRTVGDRISLFGTVLNRWSVFNHRWT